MEPDGGDPVNLSNSSSSNTGPTWSPDGRKIAFATDRDPFYNEIYVMDADGSDQTNLTMNPNPDEGPAWSPVPGPAPSAR
jgi:TolB protein